LEEFLFTGMIQEMTRQNNLMTEEWGTCSTNGGETFIPKLQDIKPEFQSELGKNYHKVPDKDIIWRLSRYSFGW